jgi:lysozyme
MIDDLILDLKKDEGLKLQAYQDHLGFWTIGYGRLIDGKRNGGITEKEAEYLLLNDIKKVEKELSNKLSYWNTLPDNVKRALCNMAFQLGVNGLLGFKNSLKFIEKGDYKNAGINLRKSKWYIQTPNRAERVIKLIEYCINH